MNYFKLTVRVLIMAVLAMFPAMETNAQFVLPENAYAIWDEDSQTLYFDYGNAASIASDYHGKTTKKWSGNDVIDYDSIKPAWHEIAENVKKVVFQPAYKNVRPKTLSGYFFEFNNLSQIDGLENLDTSEAENMHNMFRGCHGITSLDLSGFDTSKVKDMYCMFAYCESLTSLDLSGFKTSNVADVSYLFYDCENLTSLDLSGFDTSNVTTMLSMFYDCKNLTSLNLSGFKTSNVSDLSFMFYECQNLTSLNLSGFDTSNVTTMSSMFAYCENLTSLNLSGFDTSNVTDMSYLFYDCENLTSLNLSDFDTSNVTTMRSMFSDCKNLTSLDLSGFKTSNVSDLSFMFRGCKSLTSLNLSNFDTGNVTTMQTMFEYCHNLTSLNLSGFDTSNVTNMAFMFEYCHTLKTIVVGSGWNISSVTNSVWMFDGTESLVGGMGFTYSQAKSPYDSQYANTSSQGLLTNYEEYNLWVGDERVTTANMSDLTMLGSVNKKDNSKDCYAYYDPFAHTLHLSNVLVGGMEQNCGIQTRLDNLTVSFEDSGSWIMGKYGIYIGRGAVNITTTDIPLADTPLVFGTDSGILLDKAGNLTFSDATLEITSQKTGIGSIGGLVTVDSGCALAIAGVSAAVSRLGSLALGDGLVMRDLDDNQKLVSYDTDAQTVKNDGNTVQTLLIAQYGDVNLDRNVDISDIVAIINTIAGDDAYSNTANVNGDKAVDISDIVAVINIISSR